MSVILTTAVVKQACWDASSISAVLVKPGYFAMMFSKQVTAVLCCAVLEPDVLHVCANPTVQWYPSIIPVKRSPNAGYLVLCQYTGTFVSNTMLFQMQHDLGTAGCPYPDGSFAFQLVQQDPCSCSAYLTNAPLEFSMVA